MSIKNSLNNIRSIGLMEQEKKEKLLKEIVDIEHEKKQIIKLLADCD